MQDGCIKAAFETLHTPDGFTHLIEFIHIWFGVGVWFMDFRKLTHDSEASHNTFRYIWLESHAVFTDECSILLHFQACLWCKQGIRFQFCSGCPWRNCLFKYFSIGSNDMPLHSCVFWHYEAPDEWSTCTFEDYSGGLNSFTLEVLSICTKVNYSFMCSVSSSYPCEVQFVSGIYSLHPGIIRDAEEKVRVRFTPCEMGKATVEAYT